MDKINDVILTVVAFVAAVFLTAYQAIRYSMLWVKDVIVTLIIWAILPGKKAVEYEED